MRKRGPALLGSMVLALAVACSSSQQVRPPRTPPRIAVQDGMSFTGWSHRAFEGKPAAKSLANLADIGAGWVAIVPTWYQARITSTDIHPLHKTPTDRGLVHAIRTAHELGLRVMLKPHLDLSMDPPYDRPLIGTEWRHPAEWDRWNNEFLYQNRLRAVDFVALAKRAGFSIELDAHRSTEIDGVPIDGSFAHYTREQLAITNLEILARK